MADIPTLNPASATFGEWITKTNEMIAKVNTNNSLMNAIYPTNLPIMTERGFSIDFTNFSGPVYFERKQDMSIETKNAFDKLTFTRNTSATLMNQSGIVETVGNNIPRIDHNAVSLKKNGFLMEPTRTNLFQRSQEFDNAYWTKSKSTVTANVTTAPDGTSTADKLIDTIDNGTHLLIRSVTSTAVDHVVSIYVKAAELSKVRLQLDNGVGSLAGARFNLGTGSVFGSDGFIIPYRFGWYRIGLKVTSIDTTTRLVLYLVNDSDQSTYTGDGESGLYIWGAQLEASSLVTSYIPTSTTSVTRVADLCSVSTSNFPYNPAEGTILIDFNLSNYDSGFPFFWQLSDGSNDNRLSLLYYNGPANPLLYAAISTGGVTTSMGHGSIGSAKGQNQLVAFTWKEGSQELVRNGTSIKTETTSIPVGMNQLNIGSGYNGGNASGYYRKFVYIPRFCSTSELQDMTTL